MKDFIDYLTIGRNVKCLVRGEGVITGIKQGSSSYPISVLFNGNETTTEFNKTGRYCSSDKCPSLFLAETEITPDMLFNERGNIPKIVPKQGELVWVRCGDDPWECRYFSHLENGIYECFECQQKQGDTASWSECHAFDDRPF